ncbi:MAG: three-Cys-motif partner protein TcmP [Phycisphaerales bacterium]|nr:three-Cys-motif partner protein TcmP [Phycisphaerales bacterium]
MGVTGEKYAMDDASLDKVGRWTEIKLHILRKYAKAYTDILKKQTSIRHYAYIDGFAGAGTHISKTTGEEIEGSPAIALQLQFSHYHFVDLDGKRTARLQKLTAGKTNVSVYHGDCNDILCTKVFPTCRFEDYRRALCVLDPYRLNPNWEVVQQAGRMKSIEIFLNFMIMDANMNMLWEYPEGVPDSQIARMNTFWGDESWRDAAYQTSEGLFGAIQQKRTNIDVIKAYQKRLKDIAGFKYVPDPIPMRNTQGAVVYYLFFASHNKTGDKIARDVFNKYRDGGSQNGH